MIVLQTIFSERYRYECIYFWLAVSPQALAMLVDHKLSHIYISEKFFLVSILNNISTLKRAGLHWKVQS